MPEYIPRQPRRIQAMQWNGAPSFGPYRVHVTTPGCFETKVGFEAQAEKLRAAIAAGHGVIVRGVDVHVVKRGDWICVDPSKLELWIEPDAKFRARWKEAPER